MAASAPPHGDRDMGSGLSLLSDVKQSRCLLQDIQALPVAVLCLGLSNVLCGQHTSSLRHCASCWRASQRNHRSVVTQDVVTQDPVTLLGIIAEGYNASLQQGK